SRQVQPPTSAASSVLPPRRPSAQMSIRCPASSTCSSSARWTGERLIPNSRSSSHASTRPAAIGAAELLVLATAALRLEVRVQVSERVSVLAGLQMLLEAGEREPRAVRERGVEPRRALRLPVRLQQAVLGEVEIEQVEL